jgi:RNA polymerase sigma-70 factor, ECF subfamily
MADVAADFADDGVLVDALRRGDEAAFGWLLDRYDASLRRLARSYVATPAAVEEVVQDTWMAVITGVGRFEQRSAVKTWLHRILANRARSTGVRERRSVPFASLSDELDADQPAVDPGRFRRRGRRAGAWAAPPSAWDEEPEEHLLAAETLDAVERAVATLPPNQQAVLSLRDLEGWSAAEACNALELSETNQRVLLHRARATVRRALETYFEDDPR